MKTQVAKKTAKETVDKNESPIKKADKKTATKTTKEIKDKKLKLTIVSGGKLSLDMVESKGKKVKPAKKVKVKKEKKAKKHIPFEKREDKSQKIVTRLKGWMEENKITQKELAQRTDSSTNTINRLVNDGKASKSFKKLVSSP